MAEKHTYESLLPLFKEANWARLSLEARQDALQQMENLIAAEQGRPPMRVVSFTEQEMQAHPSWGGFFDGKALHLRREYFTSKPSNIPGVNAYPGVGALSVLLHEGRHCWQHYVVDHPECGADPDARRLLAMNFLGYISPEKNKSLYFAEIAELDARRYATERFRRFAAQLALAEGAPDPSFDQQMGKDMLAEGWVSKWIERLKPEELEAAEARMRELFRKNYPKEPLPEGAGVFEAARRLLETGDTFDFVDGRPLRLERAGDMAFAEAAGIEAPGDDLDPIQEALLRQLGDVRAGPDRPDRPEIRVGRGL